MDKISFKYTLNKKEIERGLKEAKVVKNDLPFKIIMTVVFALLIVNFTQQYIYPATINPNRVLGVILDLISAGMGVFMWIRPRSPEERAVINAYYENNSFLVEGDSQKLTITNKSGEDLDIPLDGKATYKSCGSIIVIRAAGKQIYFVPLSALDGNDAVRERFLELLDKGMSVEVKK